MGELELVDVLARSRPGTPDNLPLVGFASTPGLLLAVGHHRNAVLLCGVTADAVAVLVCLARPVGEEGDELHSQLRAPRAEVLAGGRSGRGGAEVRRLLGVTSPLGLRGFAFVIEWSPPAEGGQWSASRDAGSGRDLSQGGS